MGWRFRKRIKILPGIYLNVSKSGLGLNVGPKGSNITFSSKGTYLNTGIPGSGIYRRDRISKSSSPADNLQNNISKEKTDILYPQSPNIHITNIKTKKQPHLNHGDQNPTNPTEQVDLNTPINPREPSPLSTMATST